MDGVTGPAELAGVHRLMNQGQAMSTYQKLDEQIIASIRGGRHPFYSRFVTEAKRIADATGRTEERVIDGRLQALRKAGRIVSARKSPAGWVLKEPQ